MTRRTADEWALILREYADAYAVNQIKPQQWIEENLEVGAFGSAKRYVSVKKARALLESTDSSATDFIQSANTDGGSANNSIQSANSLEGSANNSTWSAKTEQASANLIEKSANFEERSANLDEKSANSEGRSANLSDGSAKKDEKSANLSEKSAKTDNRSAKSAKKSAKSAKNEKASNASAKSANNKGVKDSEQNSKQLKNKTKNDTVTTNTASNKAQSKETEKCENNRLSKQSHGAQSQAVKNSHSESDENREFNAATDCGARNRIGSLCRKQKGWGTDHFGEGRCRLHGGKAGAALKNTNATIHGIYSLYLDNDEQDIFNSPNIRTLDLKSEIAQTRVELKRCFERAAIQRDILGGAKGYFGFNEVEIEADPDDGAVQQPPMRIVRPNSDNVRELESHEDGFIGEGPKDIRSYVVRDYTEVASRLMGRLLSLVKQQQISDSYVPREESLELTDHYLNEYEAGNITAKQVGLGLARFGVATPKVIDFAMRAELEAGSTDDKDGITPEQLEREVAEHRQKEQAVVEDTLSNRASVVAMMKAGMDISPEDINGH